MGDTNILENSLTEMDWLLQLNATSSEDDDSSDLSSPLVTGTQSMYRSTTSSPQGPCTAVSSSYRAKPSFSYTHLITSAISSSTRMRMALSDIYDWIKEHHPYYRTAAPGWKNSVRHNLSLNKNFVKVARRKNEPGKGSYWALSSWFNEDEKEFINQRNAMSSYKQSYVSVGMRSKHDALESVLQDGHRLADTINHQLSNSSLNLNGSYQGHDDVIPDIAVLRSFLGSHFNTSLPQHMEWIKSNTHSEIGTSLSSNIDLDLLMETLKAVECGKMSLTSDQFADLAASMNLLTSMSSTSTHVTDVDESECRHQQQDHDRQLSELRPLDMTISDATDHGPGSFHQSVPSSLPPYLLDHTEVIQSCDQTTLRQLDNTSNLLTAVMTYRDSDDECDDEFNWNSLIDEDNVLPPGEYTV